MSKSVPVRSKPNSHAHVVGKARHHDSCTSRATSRSDDWEKITIKRTGTTGWVRTLQVMIGEESLQDTGA